MARSRRRRGTSPSSARTARRPSRGRRRRARATPEFFARHRVAELLGAERPRARRARPHHAPDGPAAAARTHYEPIEWDDAFALIAGELNALASPDEAVFYTSGRTSNEAAFLYQLFVRQFGTNNLPDCSNMCHESSGIGADGDDRRRQGDGHARGLRAAPTRSSSSARIRARTTRACSPTLQKARSATAATIVSINPLPEPGYALQEPAGRRSRLLGSGHRARVTFPAGARQRRRRAASRAS